MNEIKRWLKPQPSRKLVDVDEIPKRLRGLCDQELQELSTFGIIMIDELLGRIGQLETKAYIIFGYSGALIAYLLSQMILWSRSGVAIRTLVIITAAFGFSAAVLAAGAMMAKVGWFWPSERDWFPEKAFGNLNAIKRRHLDSLLFAHQLQGRVADQKAIMVVWGQRLLVGSLVTLAMFFVVGILSPPALNQFVRIAL